MFRMAFDEASQRPYCVLLQVVYGGQAEGCHMFDSADWLSMPTGRPPVGVEASRDTLLAHAARLREARAKLPGGRWLVDP